MSKKYSIPETLLGTYRQMTIDTRAILDTDGFATDDPSEAEKILELVVKQAIEDNGDDYEYSDAELREMFAAIYERQPDADDYEGAGLFSLICAGCNA